jgi:hypothetical protein
MEYEAMEYEAVEYEAMKYQAMKYQACARGGRGGAMSRWSGAPAFRAEAPRRRQMKSVAQLLSP